MYEILWQGEAGDAARLEPLLVSGAHDSADVPAGAVTLDRSDELVQVAGQRWQDVVEVDEDALSRVVAEALESGLLTGLTPQTWSPLSRIDAGQMGQMRAVQSMVEMMGETAGAPIGLSLARLAPVVIRDEIFGAQIEDDDAVLGCCLFWPDSFLTPLPGPGGLAVTFTPQTDREGQLAEAMMAHLASLGLEEPVSWGILWRCAYGANSTDQDGAAPLSLGEPFSIVSHELGWGLGRVFTWIGTTRSGRPDPTAGHRLLAEEARESTMSDRCPRIPLSRMNEPAVVIAVHGTMSTGVPLAREIFDAIGASAPIVRFEHDTWVSIRVNADDLATRIAALDVPRVLIVAHSRGGLVAAEAAHLVRKRAGTSVAPEIRVMTAGTPFGGTDLVKTVRGAMIGFTSASGALAGLVGSPVLSVVTRLGGLMFTLPEGIAQMDPDSDYIQSTVEYAPPVELSFGGDVRLLGPGHNWSFTTGVSDGIFGGSINDLVVPAVSATTRCHQSHVVAADHFNYPRDPQFRQALQTQTDWLTSI